MFGLTVSDEVLVSATVLGPILAVQAQKWIEKTTNKRRQKLNVFYALMATRATRLAPDHVQALNRIDLEFSGSWFLGFRRQTARERDVLEEWKSYIDQLSIDLKGKSQNDLDLWTKDCNKLFIDLLYSMSNCLGFYYDKVQLARGAYYPTGHEDAEKIQKNIHANLLNVLSGESAIKMNVVGFPFSKEAVDAQIGVQKALMSAITPDGELRIIRGGLPSIESQAQPEAPRAALECAPDRRTQL
jgi:hypothetical protein